MHFRYWKEKFFVLGLYFLLLFFLSKTGVTCVFRQCFNVPCPGCGMTRAMLSFLKGNFAEAFAAHPMFWSTPLVGIYFLSENGVLGSKKKDDFVLCLIGVGFLVQWLAKLAEIL